MKFFGAICLVFALIFVTGYATTIGSSSVFELLETVKSKVLDIVQPNAPHEEVVQEYSAVLDEVMACMNTPKQNGVGACIKTMRASLINFNAKLDALRSGNSTA